MAQEPSSHVSIERADRTVNTFSTYRNVLGEAGDRVLAPHSTEFLGNPGDVTALNPGAAGFGDLYVGCAWNRLAPKDVGFLARLLGAARPRPVDLDLGCLYELQDGRVGALQALGADNGSMTNAPYITLSHDDRTGVAPGDDEYLRISGRNWPRLKRVLVYTYIYDGAPDWSAVRPALTLQVPDHPTLSIQPGIAQKKLRICALALLENVRDGIKLTNLTEYFVGQAEMDRAYGFGLQWSEGVKGP